MARVADAVPVGSVLEVWELRGQTWGAGAQWPGQDGAMPRCHHAV